MERIPDPREPVPLEDPGGSAEILLKRRPDGSPSAPGMRSDQDDRYADPFHHGLFPLCSPLFRFDTAGGPPQLRRDAGDADAFSVSVRMIPGRYRFALRTMHKDRGSYADWIKTGASETLFRFLESYKQFNPEKVNANLPVTRKGEACVGVKKIRRFGRDGGVEESSTDGAEGRRDLLNGVFASLSPRQGRPIGPACIFVFSSPFLAGGPIPSPTSEIHGGMDPPPLRTPVAGAYPLSYTVIKSLISRYCLVIFIRQDEGKIWR